MSTSLNCMEGQIIESIAVESLPREIPSAIEAIVDATRNLSSPQAAVIIAGVVLAAGLIGYGIHALCDLVKSGCAVELSQGDRRLAVTPTHPVSAAL